MSFFEFECEHNPLLVQLRDDPALRPLLREVIATDGVLVVPQSVTLESIHLGQAFTQTHVLQANPSNDKQFISFNGSCHVVREANQLLIIEEPHSGDGPGCCFDPLADLATFFAAESPIFNSFDRAQDKHFSLLILREGQIILLDTLVSVMLVSEPLHLPDMTWPSAREATTLAVREADNPLEMEKLVRRLIEDEFEQVDADPDTTAADDTRVGKASVKAEEWESLLASSFTHSPDVSRNTETAPSGSSPITSDRKREPLFPETPPRERMPLDGDGAPAAVGDASRRRQRKRKADDFFQKTKHASAQGLVKSINAFIQRFQRNTPPPEQHVARVRDFLDRAEATCLRHELWATATPEEQDSMREGLERFVTTKLHKQLFGPTSKDLDMDRKLSERIASLQWLKPHHLDIRMASSKAGVLSLAKMELKKLNSYKAPRDKMVCILNCCKAIFSMLQAQSSPAGADEFLPSFLYVLLQANPPSLWSNTQYIGNYRHPDQMMQESGYYYTQLVGAVQFIRKLTWKSITISEEEWDAHMAVYQSRTAIDDDVERKESKQPDSSPQQCVFNGDVYAFENRSPGSLRVDEIPKLLKAYKQLCSWKRAQSGS